MSGRLNSCFVDEESKAQDGNVSHSLAIPKTHPRKHLAPACLGCSLPCLAGRAGRGLDQGHPDPGCGPQGLLFQQHLGLLDLMVLHGGCGLQSSKCVLGITRDILVLETCSLFEGQF